MVGAGGHGSNQRAFNHLVRGVLEQIAVFKRARLVFIGIAHHIAVAVFALGIHRRFPFAPSGKAGAAHAAQTGFLQSGHNVLGVFHSGQQAFTAAGTQPGNQICAHLAAGMQQ